ncbi:MAG: hypothetical protein IJN43_04515 [Ruminococcus sp.]|nr:hypothetical protein [Ruminococcus sp.]
MIKEKADRYDSYKETSLGVRKHALVSDFCSSGYDFAIASSLPHLIPIPKTTVDKSNGINVVCHRWTYSPYDSMLSSSALTYSISAHHLCLLTF